MRWRDGFSRILEFVNLIRLYFGITVSTWHSQQSPSFRDNSIFPPPKSDKGHGLFFAAVSLATRVSKESPKAQSPANMLTAPADLSNQGGTHRDERN